MMWNRMWRILFRMDMYHENLDKMKQSLLKLPLYERSLAFTNAYELERGIYLTMLRDYENALPVFEQLCITYREFLDYKPRAQHGFHKMSKAVQAFTRHCKRKSPGVETLENESALRKMQLRVVQTLISLNRPLDAKMALESFHLTLPVWQDFESWHRLHLKDTSQVWQALESYPFSNTSSSSKKRPPLDQVCSDLEIIKENIKEHVAAERRRMLTHSFGMKMRHYTTLTFLELCGDEALRSALLCYIFNDQVLGDQTGCGVCLIQMAKILQKLFSKERALDIADALIDQAIRELYLRSQSLWWLACAYWTKARIALSRGDLDQAANFTEHMRYINSAHKKDSWRQREAEYLDILLAIERNQRQQVGELYNKLFGTGIAWGNRYFTVDGALEYGKYLIEQGEKAMGLKLLKQAENTHESLWSQGE